MDNLNEIGLAELSETNLDEISGGLTLGLQIDLIGIVNAVSDLLGGGEGGLLSGLLGGGEGGGLLDGLLGL